MFKQYIKQALAQIKQHRLISVITVIATALSIFLIMLVVMLNQVKVASFSPESNRDRFLHASCMSVGRDKWGDGFMNGPMSIQAADIIYKSIELAEAVTVYSANTKPMPVYSPEIPLLTVDIRETDDAYWKVFDFNFIDGLPYDEAAVESGLPVAVISQSMARNIFKTDESVIGREFHINYIACKVIGVVKDVSTLATNAYAQIWVPYNTISEDFMITDLTRLMGEGSVTILAHNKEDFPLIREEARRKMEEHKIVLNKSGFFIKDFNRPYEQEKARINSTANYEPDLPAARRKQWMVFLILLIIPAVNLSSMTQSRINQRVAEIGVRRAFGCTRIELVWQILMENLFTTLIAGLLGFLLSLLVSWAFAAEIFAQTFNNTLNRPFVDFSILMHYSTFGYALMFCFILNLLSTGIPALHASRINIVNALLGK